MLGINCEWLDLGRDYKQSIILHTLEEEIELKKLLAIILAIVSVFLLRSCAQESTADKINRLNKEAQDAREHAREAQDNLNRLENLYDALKNP